jgi:hypothetical protein
MSESWIDDLLGDEHVLPQFEAALRSRVLAAAQSRRRHRWLLPAAAALVAVTGVATVVTFAARRESGRSVPVEPSTGPTSPPIATSPVSTTSTIASGPPSTVPRTTEAPPSSAVAPLPPTVASEPSTSTVPPTEPPASADPPVSTEDTTATPPSGAAGALDLQQGTVFGLAGSTVHDAATAVELISRSLGVPTSDTTEMTARYCPEPAEFRVVRWNDFVLEFERSGDTEYLSSWQLGDPDEEIAIGPVGPNVEPSVASGVSTADGIGIGSPASALDRFSPIASGPEKLIIGGDTGTLAVTIRDGVIAGLWSGPWDWQCDDDDEPR